MSIFNKRDQYGFIALLLHWLLFLLIAGLMASGKYSDSLPRDEKIGYLIGVHKQVGVAVFCLMAFRLLWRLINTGVEALTESRLTRLLAFITHWLLYLVVLGQALSGVLMSQFSGRDVTFLIWQVPALISKSELLNLLPFLPAEASRAGFWRDMHGWGADIIIGLVALHVVGALFHHFIRREDTLRRMWFGYVPFYAKEMKSRQRH